MKGPCGRVVEIDKIRARAINALDMKGQPDCDR